jgi:hypothetical protein
MFYAGSKAKTKPHIYVKIMDNALQKLIVVLWYCKAILIGRLQFNKPGFAYNFFIDVINNLHVVRAR